MMSRASSTPTARPGATAPELAAGPLSRVIVAKCVRMRKHLIAKHAGQTQMEVSIARLEGWMSSYICPSSHTMRCFRNSILYRDLHAVVPHNKGGLSLLQQFDLLTNTL